MMPFGSKNFRQKTAVITNQVVKGRFSLKILNQNIVLKYCTNFHASITK